jgi:two-component system phosphate regulon sensor histidine kinase PhoR
MRNKALFLKIFVGFGLMIMALGLLTVFFSFSIIRTHYDARLATELEHLGRALSSDALRLMDGPPEPLEAFLREKGRQIEARITVISSDGRVLADSEENPSSMENHRYRPEVAEALEGKIGHSERYSETVKSRMMYVGLPLSNPDGTVRAVLRLSLFTRDVEALLDKIRGGLRRAILIATALALLAALLFTLHLTRPIKALVQAHEKVAKGDFKAKVRISRRDEFRALGEGFNAMTERLDTQFEDLLRRKEEVENVMAAIREGLAVIDASGRIILANDSFGALFPGVRPEGGFYWEVILSGGLQDLIGRVRTEKKSRDAEVKIADKHILAAASWLPRQEGIALVLHDLTDLRRIEEMKRDFVSNVSHELRTPLSAIAGAVEILEDGGGKDAPAAYDILRRHVIRMRSIVEDLLKLGELEAPGIHLDLGDLDAAALARRTVDLYASRAAEKGLDLRLVAAPGLPLLRADGFHIEQMLINLVDNAVKYTEKGGVTVTLRAEEKMMVIEVGDTGPGILEEDRERIFERFYRVDKSRSRLLGGTGLGLSIVKHVVALHDGKIEVRSEEGKGTVFTVRLPLSGPAPA